MGVEEVVVGGVAAGTLITILTQIVKRVIDVEGRAAELVTVIVGVVVITPGVVATVDKPNGYQEWAGAFGTWLAACALAIGFAMGLYGKLKSNEEYELPR